MVSLESLFGDDAEILREPDFRLLLVANVQAPLGTTVLSPVLDTLIGPFGTSAADVGLLISAFTAPGIVMIPVVGALADRYGRKPVLVASLVLFGLAGTAIAATTDFRVALGLRLLQGVGFAGIVPVIITSIGDLYEGPREATGQGLRFTVSGLSGAVFPLLSGVIVLIAWQAPFLLYAGALPSAAAVWLWFEEPTTDDDADGDEHGVADGGRTGPTGPDSPGGRAGSGDGGGRSYLRALARLARRPRVLSLVVARGLATGVWIAFVTYNSFIVVRLVGGTPPQAGLLVAVGSTVFAAAGSQAGRITALVESRFLPLVAANLCLGVGFAVVLFAPGLAVAAVGTAVAGVGFGVTLSLYRSIITGLAPDDLRAGLVSVSEAGGRLSNTLTPIAMGAVIAATTASFGFERALQAAGLGVVAVGAGGGVVCLLVANAAAPVPAER